MSVVATSKLCGVYDAHGNEVKSENKAGLKFNFQQF